MEKRKKSRWTRKKNESLVNYLTRVLSANWIQVFIGLIGLIMTSITIWLMWPKPDDDYFNINREINEKMTQIKNSIHPEIINEKNDSTGELKLIKDYQIAVLDYCQLYESIESTSIQSLKTKGIDIDMVISQYLNKIEMMGDQRIKINNCLTELISFSLEKSIEEYYMFSLPKIYDNNILSKELLDFYITETKKIKNYRAEHNTNKVIKTVESLHSSLINKKLINSTLTYIMETNNIIAIRLNRINK